MCEGPSPPHPPPPTATRGERARAPAVPLMHAHARFLLDLLILQQKPSQEFRLLRLPQPRVQNCIRVLVKPRPGCFPPQWFHACACLCMSVCVCARPNADMFVFIESESRTVACAHSSARVAEVQTRGEGGKKEKRVCLKYTQA